MTPKAKANKKRRPRVTTAEATVAALLAETMSNVSFIIRTVEPYTVGGPFVTRSDAEKALDVAEFDPPPYIDPALCAVYRVSHDSRTTAELERDEAIRERDEARRLAVRLQQSATAEMGGDGWTNVAIPVVTWDDGDMPDGWRETLAEWWLRLCATRLDRGKAGQ